MALMINENITYIQHSKIEVFRSKAENHSPNFRWCQRSSTTFSFFASIRWPSNKMHWPFVDTEMVSTTHAIFAINLAATAIIKTAKKHRNIRMKKHKVWSEKKFTHISLCFSNLDCFGKKSFKLAKSTHAKDFKMVRQVHIVQKLFSGRMINHKNNFWEITNFVNK